MKHSVRLILMNKQYQIYYTLWKRKLNMLSESIKKLSSQMQPKNDGED